MFSVIIITKNEENHIARCINSVSWASQIVVVDSGSTDNTVKIAKELGAEVLETDWPGYGIQKQRALELTNQPWVLCLDADEFLEPNAKDKLQTIIQSNQADAFQIPIMMIFQGQQLKYAGCETRHIRLFKRDGAQFSPDKVHEKIVLPKNSRVQKTKIKILHESYQDWSDALNKMNLYSSLSAKNQKNTPSTLLRGLKNSFWLFIRNMFIKKWILDGKTGLLFAIYHAQSSWYRHIKQIYPDKT